MNRTFAALLLSLTLAAPQALAADRLDAREMRQVMPGNWSGRFQDATFVISISADGTAKGHYGGMAISGRWSTKRVKNGDRICLTVSSIIAATKCGELFRQGNNVVFGFVNHDKPRLWLKRS